MTVNSLSNGIIACVGNFATVLRIVVSFFVNNTVVKMFLSLEFNACISNCAIFAPFFGDLPGVFASAFKLRFSNRSCSSNCEPPDVVLVLFVIEVPVPMYTQQFRNTLSQVNIKAVIQKDQNEIINEKQSLLFMHDDIQTGLKRTQVTIAISSYLPVIFLNCHKTTRKFYYHLS